MEQHDSVCSLIRTCQLIDSLDDAKLNTFASDLLQSLSSNDLLRNTLKYWLCNNHTMLPRESFQEILNSSIPSVTDSGVSDASEFEETNSTDLEVPPPEHLLDIPEELLIHAFQFLSIQDLYSTEKVCRSLCLTARNPQSLYEIEIDADKMHECPELLNKYCHPRYLKIKSLHIDCAERSGSSIILKQLPT
eukprot:224975_1